MSTPTRPSALDQWIAGTMHEFHEAERRLARFDLSIAAARQAVGALRESGLGDYRSLTRDLLQRAFGTPLASLPERLLYELVLWPDHLYSWYIAPDGTGSDGGFHRKYPASAAVERSASLPELQRQVRLWEHTEEDVRALLGEPEDIASWWPQTTLHYGPPLAESGVSLTFDHGLLCAIDLRNPSISSR